MATPIYKIELYHLEESGGFSRQATLETYYNLEYTNKLNDIGSCVFQLNIFDRNATKNNFVEHRTQVVIKRNDSIVWFGMFYAWDASYAGVDGSITFRSYSYLRHLLDRHTDKRVYYVQEDRADIARALITATQAKENGNLNIVVGSETTGIVEDETFEYGNIAQKLIGFSEYANGFDFDFLAQTDSDNKLDSVLYRIYYPRRGSLLTKITPIRFGDITPIESIDMGVTGEIYTAAIAEGYGTGENVLISTYDTDNSDPAISSRADSAQRYYTRIEKILSYKDLTLQSQLDNAIKAWMNKAISSQKNTDFVLNGKVKPRFGDMQLGDRLRVELDIKDVREDAGDLIQHSGEARIKAITVRVDDQGKETIIPRLSFV